MTAVETPSRKAAVIELLRDRFVSDGFQFFREPTSALLPEFLRGYGLDAIAVGPDGRKIVIEVKASENPALRERLSRLSTALADKPGWELRLVRASEGPDDAPVRPGSTEELLATAASVRRLVESGERAAGLLLGWSVLEGLARRRVAGDGASTLRSPASLIEWLTREGDLTDEASRALSALAQRRNEVAHGRPSGIRVTDDLEPLFEAIASLADALGREQKASSGTPTGD